MKFARHSGQSFIEILERWHPRDVETWMAFDEIEREEERWARKHQED